MVATGCEHVHVGNGLWTLDPIQIYTTGINLDHGLSDLYYKWIAHGKQVQLHEYSPHRLYGVALRIGLLLAVTVMCRGDGDAGSLNMDKTTLAQYINRFADTV